MYYEERIENGRLMCRHSPDGKWYPASGDRARTVNSLLRMTEEARNKVFSHFCRNCATEKLPCYCDPAYDQ